LPKEFFPLPFKGAASRNVFDSEQNAGAAVSFVEDLAGVEEHRASPDRGKLSLDLKFFDRGVPWENVFKKRAEVWNVPLTPPQLREQPALGVLLVDIESGVEGSARGDDSECIVEYEKRFSDRIHDRLLERAVPLDVRDGRVIDHIDTSYGFFSLRTPK
jgi:hypothetical protein